MSRKEKILREALETKQHLMRFLRHPMVEIKQIPDWSWERLISLQVIVAATTGTLAGLVEKKSTLSIVAGLFLSPILTMPTLGIATLFFYYCFQIFAHQTVSMRRLFTLILFASIPMFIFQIISGYVSLISMVGLAFAAYLLWIGFQSNFQIAKKLALQMIVTLYATFFLIWGYNVINTSSRWEKNWGSEKIEAPEVELGQ
jgi:hypothetical protein